jgi:D-tyrosyl-tRNA(Tyr) deacylase
MIVVLQRVKRAAVEVAGRTVGQIGRGICLLVGVEKGDAVRDAEYLAAKAAELRIFPDAEGKMSLALGEVGGQVLAVSQFTLAASTRKGRRPSFDSAEDPARAEELFARFVECIRQRGFPVETGVFQAEMEVELVNDGPVTFILDSRKREAAPPISR